MPFCFGGKPPLWGSPGGPTRRRHPPPALPSPAPPARRSVAYEVGGICPAGFPHVLPRLSQRVHYGVMNPTNADGSVRLTLSSGPYWSMHSDFWNTWQQERLDELVETCLVAVVHCGSVAGSASLAWARQFGTSRYDLGYAAAAGRGGPYVAGFTNYQLGQTYRRRSDVFVRAYDGDGKVR